MNTLIRYPNGLRLVVDHTPSVRSVAVGFWVGAGSANENVSNNGISHFTEHVMFKGTDKYSAFDIAERFESMGAVINAFTGKEGTCYYFKSIDEYAERCFALLSHIFTQSAFASDELDKERKVIVEEINMVEDSPEDICYDVLAQTLYPTAPLGYTILGPTSNVLRFGKEDVSAYMDAYYNADNIVVSVAGNLDPQAADMLVRKYLLDALRSGKTPSHRQQKLPVEGGYGERIKDFEQSNIGIAYPSVDFSDPRKSAQSVFSILFGGGMSSRLFQRVREQMGLAYSVYASPLSYIHNGHMDIVLNITATNTDKVMDAVRREIDEVVRAGVTEEECRRAKIQLKSALVFSQENVQNMMTSQGKLMLYADELYDVDARIREIDAVTPSDVDAYVREVLTPEHVCVAYVGKDPKTDVYRYVRNK